MALPTTKGLYALVSIKPQTAIRNQDVISWSSFRDEIVSPSQNRFHVPGLA